MTTAIRNASESFSVHRLTIAFLFLFSVNSLGTAIIAALTGVEWSTLSPQTKFLIIAAIVVNWTGLLMAFFRTAVSKIAKGENPIVDTTQPIPPSTSR